MDFISKTIGLRLGYNKTHKLIWSLPKNNPIFIQTNHFLEYILKNDPFFCGLIFIDFQLMQYIVVQKKQQINFNPLKNSSQNSTNLFLKLKVATEIQSNFNSAFILEERLHFLFFKYLNKIKTLKMLNNLKLKIKINFLSNPILEPQWIFYKLHQDLYKGINIRRALTKISSNVIKKGAEGVKIQIKGRINGVDKATVIVEEKGKMPLQNLSSDINYYSRALKTVYGLLGVKIWVFKGFLLK